MRVNGGATPRALMGVVAASLFGAGVLTAIWWTNNPIHAWAWGITNLTASLIRSRPGVLLYLASFWLGTAMVFAAGGGAIYWTMKKIGRASALNLFIVGGAVCFAVWFAAQNRTIVEAPDPLGCRRRGSPSRRNHRPWLGWHFPPLGVGGCNRVGHGLGVLPGSRGEAGAGLGMADGCVMSAIHPEPKSATSASRLPGCTPPPPSKAGLEHPITIVIMTLASGRAPSARTAASPRGRAGRPRLGQAPASAAAGAAGLRPGLGPAKPARFKEVVSATAELRSARGGHGKPLGRPRRASAWWCAASFSRLHHSQEHGDALTMAGPLARIARAPRSPLAVLKRAAGLSSATSPVRPRDDVQRRPIPSNSLIRSL